jgi:S1-C subfamily serine protease
MVYHSRHMPFGVIKKCVGSRLWTILLGMAIAIALVSLGIFIGSYWSFASGVIEKAVIEGILDEESEDDAYADPIRENIERDVLLNPELFPQEEIEEMNGDFPFKEEAAAIVSLLCPVDEEEDYSGSGIIFEEQGMILTNRHVQGNMEEFYCTVGITNAMSEDPILAYYADIEGSVILDNDTEIDLAIMRIVDAEEGYEMPEKFPYIPMDTWGSSDALEPGESLFVIGYPIMGDETISITEGIVGGKIGADWIKITALVGPGSSGGAVLNGEGQLVGILTMLAEEGMGYAIGTDAIKEWYSKLNGTSD